MEKIEKGEENSLKSEGATVVTRLIKKVILNGEAF